MNPLTVLSWIGVFALGIGTLISVLSGGGLLTAFFGVLLTSLAISSTLPLNGKLRLLVGERVDLMQRAGLAIVAVSSWVLAGVGGWEFVPAAVVLSVSAASGPVLKLVERRRGRRSAMIQSSEMEKQNGLGGLNAIESASTSTPTPTSTSTPPPLYTSTVTIITEDPAKHANCDRLKIQTPVFATV